jgi:hypothetical protein
MQVLELRKSFVPERLPVKFASKLEQDMIDFSISLLTTVEALHIKVKTNRLVNNLYENFNYNK